MFIAAFTTWYFSDLFLTKNHGFWYDLLQNSSILLSILAFSMFITVFISSLKIRKLDACQALYSNTQIFCGGAISGCICQMWEKSHVKACFHWYRISVSISHLSESKFCLSFIQFNLFSINLASCAICKNLEIIYTL